MAVMMKDACSRQTGQDDPRPVPSTDRPPPVTVHATPAVSDGSQLGPFGQNCIIMNVVDCLHRDIWAECYLKDIIVCQQIVDFGNALVHAGETYLITLMMNTRRNPFRMQ